MPLAKERYSDDNTPRYIPGVPHVESYFLKANHPDNPRAIWLKATILGRSDAESSLAEAWCCLFDGIHHNNWGGKHTLPISQSSFSGKPLCVNIEPCHFHFDTNKGSASGKVENEYGQATWDLHWQEEEQPPLAAPLSIFPMRQLVDGPFPRSKLLTPAPALRFNGHVIWNNEKFEIDNWYGMQGHNWGKEHANTYAWAQTLFLDDSGELFCMAEGFSGRIRIAGLQTPWISALVVRHRERELRFDRLLNLWRQHINIGDLNWTLHIGSPDGEALLSMQTRPEDVVCLGYRNPNEKLSYCINSKLASTTLRVNPTHGESFECFSQHGGALEFLRSTPPANKMQVV